MAQWHVTETICYKPAAYNFPVQAQKVYTMKTLEERLRDAGERFGHETDPTGSLWVALHDALAIVADAQKELTLVGGSISSAPGTISFGSENLRHHRDIDTGEKEAADAPRIYRTEEIRDAPDGLYAFPSLFKPRSALVWRLDEVVGMMNAEPTAYPWAFGPLPDWLVFDIPTNSPSEGKG